MPPSKRKQQQKDARAAAAKKKQKEDEQPESAAAAAPSAARGSPAKKAVLGRPPKRKDANPRVKRRAEQITCAEAAAAGLAKPLGERPHTGIEQLVLDGRESRAGEKRKQIPEQGPNKQGRGKQRGSLLLAECTHGAEKELDGALNERGRLLSEGRR